MRRFLDTILHFFGKMSTSSSPGEDYINRLFLFFLILCGVIMVVVIVMILTGVIRYRSGRIQGEPDQRTGNRAVEMTWTVIPFILVTFFLVLTIKYMKAINSPSAEGKKAEIRIIAHQWWWEMEYPGYGFTTANELHIPAGRDILVQIESADVIHDWWVPDLGRKIDAIPGRINYTWLNSQKPGEFRGACSEYCGAQHAHMLIYVVAQGKEDFDGWVISQQRVPGPPADSTGAEGARLFRERTCISCHNISGISDDAHIGPDLTHVSLRQTILSGMLPASRENIIKWIGDPQKIKEGSHMPDFMLEKDEINALATYLEDLK
jgi:cytochrome c oxidase subunit II